MSVSASIVSDATDPMRPLPASMACREISHVNDVNVLWNQLENHDVRLQDTITIMSPAIVVS